LFKKGGFESVRKKRVKKMLLELKEGRKRRTPLKFEND